MLDREDKDKTGLDREDQDKTGLDRKTRIRQR